MVVDGADEPAKVEKPPFDPILDELHYPRILNRILPPDIRILAWCPTPPPGFSARFSCRERQYRYFFTRPAFTPEPTSQDTTGDQRTVKPGWLDIEAMRDAAKRFEGEHDFRNFCKIDPGKQITNFNRTVYEADIEEVKDVSSALPYLTGPEFAPDALDAQGGPYPQVFSFNVRGSAFLWHQIRHMVAVLFLVGQHLEKPSVITQLLDVATTTGKPNYTMAEETPLVLWDCVFPADLDAPVTAAHKEESLEWIYLADDPALSKFGQFGVMDGLWALWRERKLDELLANQLLQHISTQKGHSKRPRRPETRTAAGKTNTSVVVYEGGNTSRMAGKYVPVMEKDRLQSPEEQNERYAIRKGFENAADMRQKKGFGKRKADRSTVDDDL
ncbi:hypothetical protein G7046_g7734 [Stylonectria norvegica]|nr:hypothetical protein G7046_g7734 [Stylonectria norvegica]